MLHAGRSGVRFPMVYIGIFHFHNPSGRNMELGSTQPLPEMSTRIISWGNRRPLRRLSLDKLGVTQGIYVVKKRSVTKKFGKRYRIIFTLWTRLGNN